MADPEFGERDEKPKPRSRKKPTELSLPWGADSALAGSHRARVSAPS
jgi:hypothetical protein